MARRRAIKRIICISAIFIIIISVEVILFLKLGSAKGDSAPGYISVGEEAAARAYVWLSQIEDMPLTYMEIKSMMGDINLEVVRLEGEEEGQYTLTFAEGSLAECQRQAELGLEKAYREVVRHRLFAAGYDGEITDGMLDDLMRQAYGASILEYLSYCNIRLLPTMDELAEGYFGEMENE